MCQKLSIDINIFKPNVIVLQTSLFALLVLKNLCNGPDWLLLILILRDLRIL